MGRGDDRRGLVGTSAGALAFGCLLVLGMLAAHLALMASAFHAEMATRSHGSSFPSMGLESGQVAPHDADHPVVPHLPGPIREDCSTGAAILPALSLLLALLVSIVAAQSGGEFAGGVRAWPRGVYLSLPPPLAPARRRALLQVFLT